MRHMRKARIVAVVVVGMFFLPLAARGGLMDVIKKYEPVLGGDSSGAGPAPGAAEVADGLREVLKVAVDRAVSYLGKPGGYLEHAEVRIPLPESLQKAGNVLRSTGQGKLADEFVASMNGAAEKAAPEAVALFSKAIGAMTIDDARKILDGADDAATQYFRKKSTADLKARFRPVVERATDAVGVTSRYKNFMKGVGPLAGLAGAGAGWSDVDGYVTDKAVQGLFTVMAVEERRIRQDPVARSTELLQRVFGGARK